MNDPNPFSQYNDEVKRLQKITNLIPLQILSGYLPSSESLITQVHAGPKLALVVGIRLFHAPREVIIEHIMLGNGAPVVAGPFDAAAYALETPMFPLTTPMDKSYRGEGMRFVALSWGLIRREQPLVIQASSWGSPAVPPRLCGYLVCEPDPPDIQPHHPYRPPPGSTDPSTAR